ncbi:acetyl-CoA carboxylase biotin carboxyl carrier protein subunit [Bacillus fonticola]|uniref:acetyl-CoA carboxylase biotin carboxyl carrier protein subunit n=1 Tax=Bacillus fonticola TaxID=2728853 RepID=UPI0014746D6F|nr:acetyl-CoA carboxylase biotin carboxyl carrier protein subunit [Bacillus fonticola]
MTTIPSTMAGTVFKIEKSVGDTVSIGDVVVILESMKMEIPIESPVAGTVSAISFAEGDFVNEGDTLMEVEGGGA